MKYGERHQARYFEDTMGTEGKILRGLVTSGEVGRKQLVTAMYSDPHYK